MAEEFSEIFDQVKESWNNCLKNNTEVFRYSLNISKEKVLDGELRLLVQVN